MRSFLLSALVAALPALALPAVGCRGGDGNGGKPADAREEVVPVTTDKIRGESLQRRVAVVGTLFPDEEIIVSNEVEGKVVEIIADISDLVSPKDVLLRLDETDYRLKREQARFELLEVLARLNLSEDVKLAERLTALDLKQLPAVRAAQAEKRFSQAEMENAAASVRSAEADIKGAEAELVNAESRLRDAERNLKGGAATEQEVLDRRTRRDSVKAGLDSARAKQEAAKARGQSAQAKFEAAGAGEAVALADSASLVALARRKKSAVDQGDKDVSDTVIAAPEFKETRAPAADKARRYTVTARRVAVGDFARVPTELFRLMLTDPLKLRVHVPERYVGDVAKDQPVELRVEAYADRFQGAVSRINVVSEINRTFEVEILVPNGHARLKPGGFAKADILTRTDAGVVMVPQEALVAFAGVTKFFLLDQSGAAPVAREVQVRLGESREFPGRDGGVERWVEVRPVDPKRVLAAGATVITSGVGKLAEGTKVRVK